MKKIFLLILVFVCAACDTGIKHIGPTEVGVIFRKLPPAFGGGVSDKIVDAGQTLVVWPWDSLYRFDTSVQYISWGEKGNVRSSFSNSADSADYVNTRALDGNEVALAVTIQYHIDTNPEKLTYMVSNVATSNSQVYKIVEAVGRADIRTHMNALRTSAFFNRDARYSAIEKVKKAMNDRLNKEGIIVDSVILDEHRFERLLPDGKIDRSYQEKIDETQKLGQDTERELLRIETVKAKKEQEYNDTQATVNREIAEAEGYLAQAKLKAEAYFQTQENLSKAILAKGDAEVEGMSQKIKALAGAGGKALLKLEIAKSLGETNSKFVLMSESGKSGTVDVRKTDTNSLINQIGLIEGLRERSESKAELKN